jgi:tripartite-type tricarboxylate transporter receptor subunit TctC
MEQFKLAAKFDMVHIPYRAIGLAFTDIIAGRTQAMLPGSRRRFRTSRAAR